MAAPMKIALPAPHEILSPLKSADLLAAQERASSPTTWWLKVLNAISEGRLPCCYQNGEPVATSDSCGVKDIRDPHIVSRDLGVWLSDLGYTVVYNRISNDDLPDDLLPAI